MMHRPLLALLTAALLASAGVNAAASTPAPVSSPVPRATKHPAFSNKIHNPAGSVSHVSAADCDRNTGPAGPTGGQLGPNGASTSQTLVAVPIGGGSSVSDATRRQQIAEACARQRR